MIELCACWLVRKTHQNLSFQLVSFLGSQLGLDSSFNSELIQLESWGPALLYWHLVCSDLSVDSSYFDAFERLKLFSLCKHPILYLSILHNFLLTSWEVLSPTCVSSILGVKMQDVSAGLWHTVCISADGGVYSFGVNQFGQLGIGSDQAEVGTLVLFCSKYINKLR